jgi:pantoate--beta-alanine ligase
MADMQVIRSAGDMAEVCRRFRTEGKTIGLVPTMGMLHEGHLSLIRRARQENDILAISIFVNPTQFGPGEDFASYPRDPDKDLQKAREEGVDVAFVPGVEEIYPPGDRTVVEVRDLSDRLCGASRPGHFRGVATVVAKLFLISCPHRAYFGRKDYQQWVIIRRMVSDLHLEVDVIGCATVREPDGLALSSRNVYLNEQEREQALCLPQALKGIEEAVRGGERKAAPLVAGAAQFMVAKGLRVDYVSIVDPETLEDLGTIEGPAVALAAVWCGKARLIDNLEIV